MPRNYNLDLASIADELEADYNQLMRRFVFGVYSRVIQKSPVDTGRFRGNWIISIDRLITSYNDNTNKSGNIDINGNVSTIESFDLNRNENITIQNNLPYSERLDSGYSLQAPNGFTDMSIREELQVLK